MATLAVNVDHVATLRQARSGSAPDPVTAAALAEMAGAQGIVVHLREDRRHIQERDVSLLRQTVTTKLNVQMAASQQGLKTALGIKPDMVTLVPEKREELTTEGGLEIQFNREALRKFVRLLRDADMEVCLLVNPDIDQVKAAHWVEATHVEVSTAGFAAAKSLTQRQEYLEMIVNAAKMAHKVGLGVKAGRGLNYNNIGWLIDIAEIEEFCVGHAIVARAVMVGMEQAVRDMLGLISGLMGWPRVGR